MTSDITVAITAQPAITVGVNPLGAAGTSAYQLAVAGGFAGTEAEWLASLQGTDGLSAYNVAQLNGFLGTEAQWLASLQGADGPTAVSTDVGNVATLGTDSLIFVPASGGGGASNWGDLGGTLSDQTDLQAALDAKADTASLGTAAALNVPASGDAASGEVVKGSDSRLTDARIPTAHNQSADTITDGTTNKAFLATERTKLAGVATGATANDTDANLKNRANHTGTQSADTLTDGTTNKAFTSTERTKLAGIASGATANDTDANLKNRANHTGTQLASTISDFASAVASIAASQSYTPTVTNGSAASTVGRYVQIGKLVYVEIETSLNGANFTGTVVYSLPVAAATVISSLTGTCKMRDDSAASTRVGACQVSGSTVTPVYNNAGVASSVNASLPFVWANLDSIVLAFTYIAA